jgi:hypothetical protein
MQFVFCTDIKIKSNEHAAVTEEGISLYGTTVPNSYPLVEKYEINHHCEHENFARRMKPDPGEHALHSEPFRMQITQFMTSGKARFFFWRPGRVNTMDASNGNG